MTCTVQIIRKFARTENESSDEGYISDPVISLSKSTDKISTVISKSTDRIHNIVNIAPEKVTSRAYRAAGGGERACN